MVQIQRVNNLLGKLEKRTRASKVGDDGNVVVGYTAAYALFVHERPPGAKMSDAQRKAMFAKFKEREKKGKKKKKRRKNKRRGPKFLEGPAREMSNNPQTAVDIANMVPRGGLVKALLIKGLLLQRESQKRVPVDTGNLMNSAFTAVEK
jgi:hypothetical protein